MCFRINLAILFALMDELVVNKTSERVSLTSSFRSSNLATLCSGRVRHIYITVLC